MKLVNYHCTDQDGHKYLIPEQLKSAFYEALDAINSSKFTSTMYYVNLEKFNEKFGKYSVN